MKVCLINPPWITRQGNIWTNIKSTMPPLGLLYIASVLEKANIHVDVIDFQALGLDLDQIEEKIQNLQYDYYGITSTTSIVKKGYLIAGFIKKFHPSATVVLGGIHATSLPEEPLKDPNIDYVVRGEGEEAFLKLVQGVPAKGIPGISYKEDGESRHIQPNGIIQDLDALPFPAYPKLDLKLYRPAVGAYKRLPAINMLTTRGCPGKCTFCNSADIKLRKRSAENIFQEMEMLSKKYGMKEISFYDDTFTVYPTKVKRLCELLIENKIDLTWCCFARTDCVSPDMLNRMKQAGCHQVMYGIEAADEQILKNIKKEINLEKNKKAVEWAQKAGITVRCTFMFGNPGETEETIDETIRYSIYLNPDIALYNITTPYPGTEMFDWAKKNGYLTTEDWDNYDLSVQVMALPTITNELMQKKYKEAFKKFYFRFSFIAKKIFAIVSLRDLTLLREGVKSVFGFLTPKLKTLNPKR